jgi:hypothetical protein
LFNDHQTQLERAANALLGTYREANCRKRQTKQPKRFGQHYKLERYVTEETVLTPAKREDLGRSIVDSQSVLMTQVSAIQEEFDRSVDGYHEIDIIVPGGRHGAAQLQAA